MPISIALEDLIVAYRKAKVDAFREQGHPTASLFSDYEIELIDNLKRLLKNIISDSDDWVKTEKFVGDFSFIVKSIKRIPVAKNANRIIFSDPDAAWSDGDKCEVDFRIVGKHTVDFHVLCSLWIDKVGFRLEGLLSEHSYGCRLKRPGGKKGSFVDKDYLLKYQNADARQQGHFRRYADDYKRWQTTAIEAIKQTIQRSSEAKVAILTADIVQFYHRIDPSFLLTPEFVQKVPSGYSISDRMLTELLVTSLKYWSRQIMEAPSVPESFKTLGHVGIPLGMNVSKVISNLVLMNFDMDMHQRAKPIFYGRYVDDVLVAIENDSIHSSDDFWNYLQTQVIDLQIKKSANGTVEQVLYLDPIAKGTRLEFGRGKERLFIVQGEVGQDFLQKILEELDENASEWKLLPDPEENLEQLSKQLTSSSADVEQVFQGIRDSDGISVRRRQFSIHLRNLEILVTLFPRELWLTTAEEFFRLTVTYILTVERFSTYFKFLPRLLGLAVRMKRSDLENMLVNKLEWLWEFLDKMVSPSDRPAISLARAYTSQCLREGILTSIPVDQVTSEDYGGLRDLLLRFDINVEQLTETVKKIVFADLHFVPFKTILLEHLDLMKGLDQRYALRKIPKAFNAHFVRSDKRREFLHAITGLRYSADVSLTPSALYFYTRPFNLLELTMVFPNWPAVNSRVFEEYCGLFSVPFITPLLEGEKSGQSGVVNISLGVRGAPLNRTFALTSLLTEGRSWEAVVHGRPEPDLTRYIRIFRLINSIINCNRKIDYVVLPELSIPRHLIPFIAGKLKNNGTSIIMGPEYLLDSDGLNDTVQNQLMYILNVFRWNRNHQVVITQEKLIPAKHEGNYLRDKARKIFVAKDKVKYLLNHQGFVFSGLICNDLLDVNNRARLRGLIDALVVIEWNKDIDTYNFLVESASNDVHAFIIQVNNRVYGDTRIRAPYKESYLRDKVRIRGGVDDYFVIDTLNVDSLRRFQSNPPTDDGEFKPLPTGFEISPSRKLKQ